MTMTTAKTISAKLKYLHIAPRKVRIVSDVIRGLSADEAEARLFISKRRASVSILKLLRSAIANAHHNFQINKDKLFVKEIRVDQGPMFKRWTPRARGSSSPIQKKTSHVMLTLSALEESKTPKFSFAKKIKKSEKDLPAGKQGKTAHKKAKTELNEKEKEIIAPQKPASRTGFFQKVFRRKSV